MLVLIDEALQVSSLALHLLQSDLVHINTRLLRAVIEAPHVHDSIGDDKSRALLPRKFPKFPKFTVPQRFR